MYNYHFLHSLIEKKLVSSNKLLHLIRLRAATKTNYGKLCVLYFNVKLNLAWIAEYFIKKVYTPCIDLDVNFEVKQL